MGLTNYYKLQSLYKIKNDLSPKDNIEKYQVKKKKPVTM